MKNNEVNPSHMSSFFYMLKRDTGNPMAALEEICAVNNHYAIGRLLPHDPTYPRQRVESIGIPGCLNYQMPGLCQPVYDSGSPVRIFKMASAKPLNGKEGAILNLIPICEIPEELLTHPAIGTLFAYANQGYSSVNFPMNQAWELWPALPTNLKLEATVAELYFLLFEDPAPDTAPDTTTLYINLRELCNAALYQIVGGCVTLYEVLKCFVFKDEQELLEESLATLKQKTQNAASSANHPKTKQATKHGRKQKEALRKILDSYRAHADS